MKETQSSDARAVALYVLNDCRTAKAWADVSLKGHLEKAKLSGSDAALCSRLVYGVVQNRILLDYYLQFYCNQELEHLQAPLLDILRLGAYQILFLDRVPDHAAVHETVELTKLCGRVSAAGLVNAVLRKISQYKDRLPPLPETDDLCRLSVQYSHPKWLVKRLLPVLGSESTEAFLRMNNEAPPITIQVNTLQATLEDVLIELEANNIKVQRHPWAPDCLNLTGTGDLTALPAFQKGHFLVQDASARMVTIAAGIQPEQQVLDVCAAPGGKSFSAAIAMKDHGVILACDLYEKKLRRLRDNAIRLGLHSIQTQRSDGRKHHTMWDCNFDVVLVDAPCSGFGIIRKKPDIRYKNLNELFALPVIQRSLLDNASLTVKPGGVLVYSTCTVLPEENGQVILSFLSEHPEFEREPFTLPDPVGKTTGELTLWPQVHGTDGFYICKMRKQTV